MASLPLNMFQRLVRTWEAVHPYNAGQVLKLSGNADPRAIQAAWYEALASLGLGRVRSNSHTFNYVILNGDAEQYPVQVLAYGTCLETHLGDALNVPFLDDQPPFRPFLIPGDNFYYLGVIYQHWVADSVSIRMLLREWCARLFDPGLSQPRPSRIANEGYWELFGNHAAMELDRNVLDCFRHFMRFRSVRKVVTSGERDYPVRVLLRELPEGLIGQLRSTARDSGMRVGDVLLAAVGQAAYRHLPLQNRPNRRDLAIGNIVDLRSYCDRDLSNTFGLFLGFTHVVCSKMDLGDFPRMMRSIASQNRVRRRDGVAQRSLTWMSAALFAQRFIKPKQMYKFYRKEMPLAAGLSNVNLGGTWAERLHPYPLLDYIRVSPTGPMVPAVLSATTLGSRMSLCLTYRPALIDQAGASAMAATMIECLSEAASVLAR